MFRIPARTLKSFHHERPNVIPAQNVALLLGGLFSLPGIVGTIIIILVVIMVTRVVLKIAWKVALVVLVAVLVLWFAGMLGPVAGMLGVGG